MKEAAALLKVSQKTIHRWDAAGKIICSRTPGNHRRIPMSEVVRLQAQQNILPLPDPISTCHNSPRELPQSSLLEVSSTHDPLPWRHDMKALKAQLKLLHYLLMNSRNSTASLTVLKELMEILKEVMMSIDIFHSLRSNCLHLWERIISGVNSIERHEIEKESASMQINSSRAPPKEVSPPKDFRNARKNAHDLFFRLVKTSMNSRIDREEQQRVHGIIEGILAPYKRLTEYLVTYPEGTLEHDVTKLLLTSHPSDYNIMRNKWSIRTLARACQQLGTKSASKSQIGRFYKKIQWYHRTKEELKSPDPQFGTKMKAIGTAMACLNENDVLLYGDEFKFTSKKVTRYLQQTHAPKGLHYKLKEESGEWYHPACAIQITGVFDPIHHRLETIEIPDLTFESVAQGIHQLCVNFFSEITGKIVLILDNASSHGPELLKPYLHERFGDRVVLLYLPTYSPNNNPIEGVWKTLLMSIVRQCSTQEELRLAFYKAITAYQSKNTEGEKGELVLYCPICHERLYFQDSRHESSIETINKHACFNIPDLTPYTVDVLTHSLEVLF